MAHSRGRGVHHWPSGMKYEGEFEDDNRHRRHGHGVQSWSDHHFYDGEWKNDEKNGRGYLQWSDGERYNGRRRRRPERRGERRLTSAQGTFKHGVRSGSGVNVWPDGDAYEVRSDCDSRELREPGGVPQRHAGRKRNTCRGRWKQVRGRVSGREVDEQ
eukprot:758322-Hanusia_phi.AAC.4